MPAKTTRATKSSARSRKADVESNDLDDELSDIDFGDDIMEDNSTDQPKTDQPKEGQQNKSAADSKAESNEGGGKPSDDGGDGQPKKRKRRRRRNKSRSDQSGGGDGQAGGGDGQTRNQGRGRGKGGQNQGRGRGGGGGGGGNPRGSGGQGGSVTRRSKSFNNAPQSEAAVLEGTIEGILELHPKGYGFLRSPDNDYAAQEIDPFVSSSLVEKYNLREGIKIKGEVGAGSRGQGPRLKEIETIDARTPDEYQEIRHFETLTPINPHEQIRLETGPLPITMRVMDLLTPIGRGQRALLVAPPRSGKTMLLQDIANSVSVNHPEIHLIVLLIDERPEEVTEMRRKVKGEVVASSMDRDIESHVRISQLVIERGKRLAESGKDCFILLDSITRTARAFNKWVGNSGRTGTGGLDVKAMDIPRKMFGTARLFDEGGSLTVAATALIETGSRMDDAIFQEFKGTGNMELVLNRDLADRRIYPAIDIARSGTRREEKILDPEVLEGVTMLRRSLLSLNSVEAMDQLIRTLGKFESNAEFLSRVKSIL